MEHGEDVEERISDGEEEALNDVQALFRESLVIPNIRRQVRNPVTAGSPPPPPPPSSPPPSVAPISAGTVNFPPEMVELLKRMDARLEKVEEAQQVQCIRNAVMEVNQRQLELSKREKDRVHRMNEFTQPMAKYHALDLCDLEHQMEDIVATADMAVPSLSPLFGSAGPDGDEVQVEIDPSTPLTVGEVTPVWNAVRSMLSMLDDRVHIQQMAGTT